FPKAVSNTSNSSTGGQHSLCRQARPNSERRTLIIAAGVSRPAGSISYHRCARFRTQRLTPADYVEVLGGVPKRSEAEAWKEAAVMGKLEGKVAVITG